MTVVTRRLHSLIATGPGKSHSTLRRLLKMMAAKVVRIPSGMNVTEIANGQMGTLLLLTSLKYLTSVERVDVPSDGIWRILMFM